MKFLDFILVFVISLVCAFGAIKINKEMEAEKIVVTVDVVSLIETKTKEMKSPNEEALMIYTKALNMKLSKYAKIYNQDIFVKQALASTQKTLDITKYIKEELVRDGLLK